MQFKLRGVEEPVRQNLGAHDVNLAESEAFLKHYCVAAAAQNAKRALNYLNEEE